MLFPRALGAPHLLSAGTPRLVAKLLEVSGRGGTLAFVCPGCSELHQHTVRGLPDYDGPVWDWNGSLELPTLKPSLLVTGEKTCHSYLTEGTLQFLSDCTHELRNQTVKLEPVDETWLGG